MELGEALSCSPYRRDLISTLVIMSVIEVMSVNSVMSTWCFNKTKYIIRYKSTIRCLVYIATLSEGQEARSEAKKGPDLHFLAF